MYHSDKFHDVACIQGFALVVYIDMGNLTKTHKITVAWIAWVSQLVSSIQCRNLTLIAMTWIAQYIHCHQTEDIIKL